MSATDDEHLLRRIETLQSRIEALANAEEIVLCTPLSRQERACRKAARDAYALVLDMMSEDLE